jgi:hypothetical protein
MKLFINDKEISYSIENEKNLQDIVAGINRWSLSEGMTIDSISRDGVPLDLFSRLGWDEITLEKIKELKVRVTEAGIRELSNTELILEYYQLIEEMIRNGNADGYREVLLDEPTVRQLCASLFTQDEIQSFIPVLPSLLPDDGNTLLIQTQKTISLVHSRKKEWSQPFNEFTGTLNILKQMTTQISDIGVNFQIGKNKEALSSVMALTEILSKLARLSSILRLTYFKENCEKEKLSEDQKKINGFLKVFSEAMGSKDVVTMSDVLEYELVPFLTSLNEYWTGKKVPQ